jgi:hypothetical protein
LFFFFLCENNAADIHLFLLLNIIVDFSPHLYVNRLCVRLRALGGKNASVYQFATYSAVRIFILTFPPTKPYFASVKMPDWFRYIRLWIAGNTTAHTVALQLAALVILIVLTLSSFTGRAIRREQTPLSCRDLLAAAAVPPTVVRNLGLFAADPAAREGEALRRLVRAAQEAPGANSNTDTDRAQVLPADLADFSAAIAAAEVDQIVMVIVDAMTPRAALGPYDSTAGLRRNATTTNGTAATGDNAWFRQIRSELQRFADTGEPLVRHRVPSPHAGSEDDDDVVVGAASLGFISVADAPTATTQRLRGLTTGTIPVLLEISSSFNVAAVEEDNLIDQLARDGDPGGFSSLASPILPGVSVDGVGGDVHVASSRLRSHRATVVGDDTWVRLYPNRSVWSYAAGYESLDIQDLESVDNGVLQNLRRALRWPPPENLGGDSTSTTPPRNAGAGEEAGSRSRSLDRFQRLQRQVTDPNAAAVEDEAQVPFGAPDPSVRDAQAVWAEDAWYAVDGDLVPPQLPLSLRPSAPESQEQPSSHGRPLNDIRGMTAPGRRAAGATQPPSRLVVAHMLGVDHAGHRHDGADPHLHAKVRHHDAILRVVERSIVERTAAAARGECAPVFAASAASSTTTDDDGATFRSKKTQIGCEAYPRKTLLIAMGDHGMTSSGDHGGGTEAETDTFVFARVFAPVEWRTGEAQKNASSGTASEPNGTSSDDVETPRMTDVTADTRSKAALAAAAHYTRSVRRAQCNQTKLCRVTDGPAAAVAYATRQNVALIRNGSLNGSSNLGETLTAVDQIDLTSTLALLLGVPIPFANIGHVIPELLSLSMAFPKSASHPTTAGRNAEFTVIDSESGADMTSVTALIDQVIAGASLCNAHQIFQLDRTLNSPAKAAGNAAAAVAEALLANDDGTTSERDDSQMAGDGTIPRTKNWTEWLLDATTVDGRDFGATPPEHPLRGLSLNLDRLITFRIAAARRSLVAVNHAGVAASLGALAVLLVFFVLPWLLVVADGPLDATAIASCELDDGESAVPPPSPNTARAASASLYHRAAAAITFTTLLRAAGVAVGIVRAHAAFGNSCIMREDVGMVFLTLCALVVAAHLDKADVAATCRGDNHRVSAAPPSAAAAVTRRLLPRLTFLFPVLVLAFCTRIGLHLGRRVRDFDSNAIAPFPPLIGARRAVLGCLDTVQSALGADSVSHAWAAASGCANVAFAAIMDRPLSPAVAAAVSHGAHVWDPASGAPSDHIHFGHHHDHHHSNGEGDYASFNSAVAQLPSEMYAQVARLVESAAQGIMHCVVLLTAALSPPARGADAASDGLLGAAIRLLCDVLSGLASAATPWLHAVVGFLLAWTILSRVVVACRRFTSRLLARPPAERAALRAFLASTIARRINSRIARSWLARLARRQILAHKFGGVFRLPAALLLLWLFVVGNATTRVAVVAQCGFLVLFFHRFAPMASDAVSSSSELSHDVSVATAAAIAPPNPGLIWQALALHCATWAFFFAGGLQTALSSIDWSLASYWLQHADGAGPGRALVMLSHVARAFLITDLLLCAYSADAAAVACGRTRTTRSSSPQGQARGHALWVWLTRLRVASAALHALVTGLVGVGVWLHANHLMVTEVYFPRLAFQVVLTACQCAAAAFMPLLV